MGKRRNNEEHEDTPPRVKARKNRNADDAERALETEDDTASSSSSASVQSYDNSTRSGKILSIKLKNFMCHRNLAVDFNRRTNLIVGKNGSGKSAILTALIVGLGAKANATDRSSNIKQLIRTGENSCTIEVHLSNDGDDAYERHKYGDRITVIRHVTSSGVSTYKLKSQWGNVLSTSRADVLRLILYMNIQVDNPVCVLTQDASRSFLRDSNPKKRFELFQRATQMDVVTEKLTECNAKILKARHELEFQQKKSDHLKKDVDRAQEKHAQFQSMAKLKKEIQDLKREMSWIAVVDQEKLVAQIQEIHDETMQEKEKIVSSTTGSVSAEQQLRNELETKKGELTDRVRVVSNFDAKFTQMRDGYKQKNELYLQKVRDMKRLESKRNRLEKDLQELKEHMMERSQTTQSEVSKLRKKNDDSLAAYKQQYTEMSAMQAGTNRDLEMFRNTKEQLHKQYATCASQLKEKSDQTARLTAQQKTINRDSRSNLQLYGDFMPRLVADIENRYQQGKFTEMPLGPIGSFVEVHDRKYLNYVEDIVKSVASAFYVNDAKDRILLNDLMKKYPQANRCSVITSRFIKRTYDVAGKSVRGDSRGRAVIDLIKVSNPDVMNCLIDQCKIDAILITDNQDHAINITSRKENVPANLLKVIVTEPYRDFFPAPMYRSYAKPRFTARVLQLNMSQRARYLEEEIAKLTQEMAQLQLDKKTLTAKGSENERLLMARRERLAELNTQLASLQVNIKELEDFEYPAEDESIVLENEVEVQTKMLDKVNNEVEEATGRCAELKVGIDTLEADIKAKRQENQQYKDSLHDKQRELDQLSQEIAKCASTKAHSETKLQKLEETLAKLNKELSDANEKLQRQTRTAEKSGARVDVQNSVADIQRKIKINERKIDVISKSDDTLEDVERKLNKARGDLEENLQLVNAMTQTIQMLRSSTKVRFTSTRKLMHYMVSTVSYQFERITALRGFKGELIIDLDERTLDIKVVPRDKGVENAKSKTNSLSGGERSYSTVAFLISLWSCVDNPFYFLDEYDVFTDQVNRMYMTKLLIHEATKKSHQQYAFLTPQDTSDIDPTDSLSVLRMDDPDRS